MSDFQNLRVNDPWPAGELDETDYIAALDTQTGKMRLFTLDAMRNAAFFAAQRAEGVHWVTDPVYGATGGSDDSAAFQAAVNAAEGGNGEVRVPAGTWRANFAVGPNITIRGAGVRATTIKAVAGSNTDVIRGKNFDTLTGRTGATRTLGDNYVNLCDLTIDGDKSTQTSGWGVRLWGRSHVWERIVVQNCKSGGVYTEFTTHPGGQIEDLLEGYFDKIKIHGNDGNAWTFRGPHDSHVTNYVAVSNTGWAFYGESAGGGGYNGTLGYAENWNSWLNGHSFYFGSIGAGNNIAATGVGGTGIEMGATSGAARLDNVLISGHATGLIPAGSNHVIRGIVQGCTQGVVMAGAGGCHLHLTGSNNATAIVAGGELASNHVVGTFSVNVGQALYSGTPSPISRWDLVQYGSAGNVRLHGFATRTISVEGWTPQLPQSNSVIVARDATETLSNKTLSETCRYAQSVLSISADTTLTRGTQVVLCNAVAGAITVTLPPVANWIGQTITIKKTEAGANTVTVDGNGGETIDGSATYVIPGGARGFVTLASNGSSVYVVGS